MGYSKEIYDLAYAEIARRRAKAEREAAELRSRIYAKYPRAIEIENELKLTAYKVFSAVKAGENSEAVTKRIEEENDRLQKELADILKSEGENATSFYPAYSCPKCRDIGTTSKGLCECMKKVLAEKHAAVFNQSSGMSFTNMDDMKLDFYSDVYDERLGCVPREHMRDILEYCHCYGENFCEDADSLLLSGPTGVGKTHAALAIAKMASEKGFCPIYQTAQQIFHKLEREHFGKEEGDTESLLIDCDLLILDDLGTEMTTSFTISELLAIINSRMLKKLPTIISTNLTLADWQGRYGEAIASRVLGTFQPLLFVGKDIRQQKMERRLNED